MPLGRLASRPWRIVGRAAYGSGLLIVVLFAAEAALRIKGFVPWRPLPVPIQVEPGGRFFQPHPTLGYTHLPGDFTVTLQGGYAFRVSHLGNGLRRTSAEDRWPPLAERPEIWVFGCSFTHGWSVNDEDTYPWRLQERFPGFRIVNFGVSGYGTIHSLLQFREALQSRPPPRLVILAYAGFHDVRNTFLRQRRKETVPWNRLGPLHQPYARLDRGGNLRLSASPVAYREVPLMRHSALIDALESAYNRLEDRWQRSRRVSEALILEIGRVAEERGSGFLLAIIERFSSAGIEGFAERNGIRGVDISVDLFDPAYANLPHDVHPGPLAHRNYADHLEAFLRGPTTDLLRTPLQHPGTDSSPSPPGQSPQMERH